MTRMHIGFREIPLAGSKTQAGFQFISGSVLDRPGVIVSISLSDE